jgi:fluoroquinolone resistance protein
MSIKHCVEDQKFENINYSGKKIDSREFVDCVFDNCDFSNSNLSNIKFTDCEFHLCNLSMTNLNSTSLKTVKFFESKLVGLDFSNCNEFLFSVFFEKCNLQYASFFKRKLHNTTFKDCSLNETIFSEVDLSLSVFLNCDLINAIFEKTILSKVDFTTSYNYIIDPEKNNIKKAKFSKDGILGLLAKYDIIIE